MGGESSGGGDGRGGGSTDDGLFLALPSPRSPLCSTGGDFSGRPRVLLNSAVVALAGEDERGEGRHASSTGGHRPA